MKKYKPQVSIYQKPTANVNDTVTFPPLPVETPWECKCGGGSGEGTGIFLIGVTTSDGTKTMDKTWAEIKAAADAGLIPFGLEIGETAAIYGIGNIGVDDGTYGVTTFDNISFTASAESGYPAYTEGGTI